MKRRHGTVRKALAAWLPALVIVMSVAIPVLERADFAHEPVVESEHDPSSCPPAHDHTICTQVGANHAFASAPVLVDHTHPVLRSSAPTEAPASSHAVFRDGPPSRAPPLT